MRWLRRIWTRFLEWLRSLRLPGGTKEFPGAENERELPAPRPPPAYTIVRVTEDPDELLPQTLYAVGEGGHLWHVVLVCPCSCGATIALNLLPDDSPRWTLHEHPGGPTLSPSVWRTAGCKSHFILRRGEIIWCHGRAPGDVRDSEYR